MLRDGKGCWIADRSSQSVLAETDRRRVDYRWLQLHSWPRLWAWRGEYVIDEGGAQHQLPRPLQSRPPPLLCQPQSRTAHAYDRELLHWAAPHCSSPYPWQAQAQWWQLVDLPLGAHPR